MSFDGLAAKAGERADTKGSHPLPKQKSFKGPFETVPKNHPFWCPLP